MKRIAIIILAIASMSSCNSSRRSATSSRTDSISAISARTRTAMAIADTTVSIIDALLDSPAITIYGQDGTVVKAGAKRIRLQNSRSGIRVTTVSENDSIESAVCVSSDNDIKVSESKRRAFPSTAGAIALLLLIVFAAISLRKSE